MRFGNPSILWLLMLLPVLAWLLLQAARRRRQILNRFASEDALAKAGITTGYRHVWLRLGALLLSTGLLILAAARPQWGFEDRKIISRGVDVVIAIDTSASMLAQDYKPNRLERARNTLQNIIWDAQGDRIGLVAFAGAAAIVCPLTLDYRMAETALQAVDPTTISTRGTNLLSAIKAGMQAFDMAGPGDKVLVMLTDGEHHGEKSEVIAAAEEARGQNIIIHAIGIGSEDGSVIPTGQGFKKDLAGEVVQSRLDFETLERIASITGGKAVKAGVSGAADVSSIMSSINSMKGSNREDQSYRVYHERFPWFLGAGLLILLCESMAGKWGVASRRFGQRRRLAAASVVVVGLMGSPATVEAYPGQTHVLSRQGLQNYNQSNYQESAELYGKATTVDPNNSITRFNQGAALAGAGKNDEATSAFKQVYDPQNPVLNASALFNATTLAHGEFRKGLDQKKAEWSKDEAAGADKTISEVGEFVGRIDQILSNYREALLDSPADLDIKTNYEIALKDREELLNILNQQQENNQQPQPQQQPQQQNNDDQQQQGKGQQENEQKSSDSGQQGEPQNQQQQPEQGEQKQDQESQESQQPQQGENQQTPAPEPDESKEEDQQKQGEGEQKENEADKAGEEQSEKGEEKEGEGQAKPTPGPTPSPSPTPAAGTPASAGSGSDQGGEPAPAVGEMSQSDVDRLLNTLPPEDTRAIQRLLNNNFPNPERPEKDW